MVSWPRSAACVAALLLTAACGSTVAGQSASQVGVPNGTVGSTGTSEFSAPQANSGAVAPDGSTVPGSVPGGVGTSPTGTHTGPSSTLPSSGPGMPRTGGSGGVLPAAAPGITATTIYIGAEYSSQAAAANSALGAGQASGNYDERDVFNATLDYVNKHGGVGGRHLQAIYYDINLQNNRDAEDQAACEKFTQDNKVFVIIAITDVLRQCAEKAGVVAIGQASSETSDTMKRFPHYFDPIGLRFDRLGQVTVNGLFNAGYFRGKLGFITWDSAVYHQTYEQGYVPALRSHHISLATDPVFVPVPDKLDGIGGMSPSIASAINKFRTAGVDHVIIQDGPAGVFGGDGLTFEFMTNARSQGYKPRYGGNRYNDPGGSINPKDQMDHMLAVSDTDLTKEDDAGWHLNKARVDCFKIQADAGHPVHEDNANDPIRAAAGCDTAFLMRRIINGMSSITTNGFLQAVPDLHTSFKSASVYGTNLFPGRRDGSDYVRVLEYLQSCDCVKFQGPPYNVG